MSDEDTDYDDESDICGHRMKDALIEADESVLESDDNICSRIAASSNWSSDPDLFQSASDSPLLEAAAAVDRLSAADNAVCPADEQLETQMFECRFLEGMDGATIRGASSRTPSVAHRSSAAVDLEAEAQVYGASMAVNAGASSIVPGAETPRIQPGGVMSSSKGAKSPSALTAVREMSRTESVICDVDLEAETQLFQPLADCSASYLRTSAANNHVDLDAETQVVDRSCAQVNRSLNCRLTDVDLEAETQVYNMSMARESTPSRAPQTSIDLEAETQLYQMRLDTQSSYGTKSSIVVGVGEPETQCCKPITLVYASTDSESDDIVGERFTHNRTGTLAQSHRPSVLNVQEVLSKPPHQPLAFDSGSETDASDLEERSTRASRMRTGLSPTTGITERDIADTRRAVPVADDGTDEEILLETQSLLPRVVDESVDEETVATQRVDNAVSVPQTDVSSDDEEFVATQCVSDVSAKNQKIGTQYLRRTHVTDLCGEAGGRRNDSTVTQNWCLVSEVSCLIPRSPATHNRKDMFGSRNSVNHIEQDCIATQRVSASDSFHTHSETDEDMIATQVRGCSRLSSVLADGSGGDVVATQRVVCIPGAAELPFAVNDEQSADAVDMFLNSSDEDFITTKQGLTAAPSSSLLDDVNGVCRNQSDAVGECIIATRAHPVPCSEQNEDLIATQVLNRPSTSYRVDEESIETQLVNRVLRHEQTSNEQDMMATQVLNHPSSLEGVDEESIETQLVDRIPRSEQSGDEEDMIATQVFNRPSRSSRLDEESIETQLDETHSTDCALRPECNDDIDEDLVATQVLNRPTVKSTEDKELIETQRVDPAPHLEQIDSVDEDEIATQVWSAGLSSSDVLSRAKEYLVDTRHACIVRSADQGNGSDEDIPATQVYTRFKSSVVPDGRQVGDDFETQVFRAEVQTEEGFDHNAAEPTSGNTHVRDDEEVVETQHVNQNITADDSKMVWEDIPSIASCETAEENMCTQAARVMSPATSYDKNEGCIGTQRLRPKTPNRKLKFCKQRVTMQNGDCSSESTDEDLIATQRVDRVRSPIRQVRNDQDMNATVCVDRGGSLSLQQREKDEDSVATQRLYQVRSPIQRLGGDQDMNAIVLVDRGGSPSLQQREIDEDLIATQRVDRVRSPIRQVRNDQDMNATVCVDRGGSLSLQQREKDEDLIATQRVDRVRSPIQVRDDQDTSTTVCVDRGGSPSSQQREIDEDLIATQRVDRVRSPIQVRDDQDTNTTVCVDRGGSPSSQQREIDEDLIETQRVDRVRSPIQLTGDQDMNATVCVDRGGSPLLQQREIDEDLVATQRLYRVRSPIQRLDDGQDMNATIRVDRVRSLLDVNGDLIPSRRDDVILDVSDEAVIETVRVGRDRSPIMKVQHEIKPVDIRLGFTGSSMCDRKGKTTSVVDGAILYAAAASSQRLDQLSLPTDIVSVTPQPSFRTPTKQLQSCNQTTPDSCRSEQLQLLSSQELREELHHRRRLIAPVSSSDSLPAGSDSDEPAPARPASLPRSPARCARPTASRAVATLTWSSDSDELPDLDPVPLPTLTSRLDPRSEIVPAVRASGAGALAVTTKLASSSRSSAATEMTRASSEAFRFRRSKRSCQPPSKYSPSAHAQQRARSGSRGRRTTAEVNNGDDSRRHPKRPRLDTPPTAVARPPRGPTAGGVLDSSEPALQPVVPLPTPAVPLPVPAMPLSVPVESVRRSGRRAGGPTRVSTRSCATEAVHETLHSEDSGGRARTRDASVNRKSRTRGGCRTETLTTPDVTADQPDGSRSGTTDGGAIPRTRRGRRGAAAAAEVSGAAVNAIALRRSWISPCPDAADVEHMAPAALQTRSALASGHSSATGASRTRVSVRMRSGQNAAAVIDSSDRAVSTATAVPSDTAIRTERVSTASVDSDQADDAASSVYSIQPTNTRASTRSSRARRDRSAADEGVSSVVSQRLVRHRRVADVAGAAGDPAVTISHSSQPDTDDVSSVFSVQSASTSVSLSGRSVSARNRPRVLFTGYSDDNDRRIVTTLGGEVVNHPRDCTVLVTGCVKRTIKLLCVFALGRPIVSPDWLTKSKQARGFLDPWQCLVSDREAEKRFGFRLELNLRKASRRAHPLLYGWSIHATPSVLPPPGELKDVVESAGGVYLGSVPRSSAQRVLVVSCVRDKHHWQSAIRLQLPVVSTELLLTGLLRQSLDVRGNRLA